VNKKLRNMCKDDMIQSLKDNVWSEIEFTTIFMFSIGDIKAGVSLGISQIILMGLDILALWALILSS
jgi:hypothetical protein